MNSTINSTSVFFDAPMLQSFCGNSTGINKSDYLSPFGSYLVGGFWGTLFVEIMFPLLVILISTSQCKTFSKGDIKATSEWYVIGSLFASSCNFLDYFLRLLSAFRKTENLCHPWSVGIFVRFPFFHILATTTLSSTFEMLSWRYGKNRPSSLSSKNSNNGATGLYNNPSRLCIWIKKLYSVIIHIIVEFSVCVVFVLFVVSMFIFWFCEENTQKGLRRVYDVSSTVFSIIQFLPQVIELLVKKTSTSIIIFSLLLPFCSNSFLLYNLWANNSDLWAILPFLATVIMQFLVIFLKVYYGCKSNNDVTLTRVDGHQLNESETENTDCTAVPDSTD